MKSPSPSKPARGRVRLTPEGLLWLLAALVLLVQGFWRSFNLVTLIGCLLLSLWLLNFLWVFFRFRFKSIELERRVENPVFAKQPFTVTLDIRNPSGRKHHGLRVIDRGRHHDQSWFIPLLRPDECRQNRFDVTVPRRGRYRWPALRLSTGYPFGLFRLVRTLRPSEDTIVLPPLGRLDRHALRRMLWSRQQSTATMRRPVRRRQGAQAEYHGVREFCYGDSPRWVHWRTTARRGQLMVREFEEPPHENLILILEPWLPQSAEQLAQSLSAIGGDDAERGPLELLELAISFAATVCWEWGRHPGAQLALGIAASKPEVRVDETGKSRVFPFLESLALAEGGPLYDFSQFMDRLLKAPLPKGPVLLVSTQASGLSQALAAQLQRPVTLVDVSAASIDDLFEIGDASPEHGNGAQAGRRRLVETEAR